MPSTVLHMQGYRRVWMFPRAIRKIQPAKMSMILNLLQSQIGMKEWQGNQDIQNDFCKALEMAGIKRKGAQYDPKSGGPRTYLSQLECLGLVFTKDGKIQNTIAGQCVADGDKPLKVMQWLLIKNQYPSIYSTSPNVKIHPDIKVKPFLFVLKLMKEAKYLEPNAFVVPVIYGHNDLCVDICLNKIKNMHEGSLIEDIIDSKDDIYLVRSKGDFGKDINNIRDIANTCKNYMESCNLIEKDVIDNKLVYVATLDGLSMLEKHKDDDFIELKKNSEEGFQRKFGCYGKDKDTRNFEFTYEKKTKNLGLDIIRSRYVAACGTSVSKDVKDKFIKEMKADFGFDQNQIEIALDVYSGKEMDIYQSHFIEISKGGIPTANEFEKAIVSLLTERFNMKAFHTGQRKRPVGRGGYADILVVTTDDGIGILDAKATAKYSISSGDYRAITNDYVKNFSEHTEAKGKKILFCGYVAGGFSDSVSNRIKEIESVVGVPCVAISSRFLIELAIDGDTAGLIESFKYSNVYA